MNLGIRGRYVFRGATLLIKGGTLGGAEVCR